MLRFCKNKLDPDSVAKDSKYRQDFCVELYFEDTCDKCSVDTPLEDYCAKCSEFAAIEAKNWTGMMNTLKVTSANC